MKFHILEIETLRPHAWADHYSWIVLDDPNTDTMLAVSDNGKTVRIFFNMTDCENVGFEPCIEWVREQFEHFYCGGIVCVSRDFKDSLDLVTWNMYTPAPITFAEFRDIGWAPAVQLARN